MPSKIRPLGEETSYVSRPLADLHAYLEPVVGGACERALLRRAMTHRSYAYEHDNAPHNERLEFLGDAVLGVVVTDSLYRRNPDLPEGHLAKLRSAVVNTRALAQVSAKIDLGAFVLLGRGEEATGGREKASILADTTEALIGCVYISLGMDAASALVHHLLDSLMAESAQWGAALDWKTSLQELASTAELAGPEYVVANEGPDHDKTFTAQALVGAEVMGTGEGSSKKAAEQLAAEAAWNVLTDRAAAVLGAPPVVSSRGSDAGTFTDGTATDDDGHDASEDDRSSSI